MKKFLTLLALLLALTMTCAMAQTNSYTMHDTAYPNSLTLTFTQPAEDWDIYGVDEPGPYTHLSCFPDAPGGELFTSVFVAGGWEQYDYNTMSVDQILERGESWGLADPERVDDYISTEYVTYKGVPFAAIHYREDNKWEYMTFANGTRVVFTCMGFNSLIPGDDQAQEYIRRTIDATDLIGGSTISTDSSIYTGPSSASGMVLDYGVSLSYPASWGIEKSSSSNQFAGAWLDGSVTGAGRCYFCVYVGDTTGYDSNSMSDGQLIDLGNTWGNNGDRFYTIDCTTTTVGGVKYALVHCGTTANAQSSDAENWQLLGFVNGTLINLEIDNDSGMFDNYSAAMFLEDAAMYVSVG